MAHFQSMFGRWILMAAFMRPSSSRAAATITATSWAWMTTACGGLSQRSGGHDARRADSFALDRGTCVRFAGGTGDFWPVFRNSERTALDCRSRQRERRTPSRSVRCGYPLAEWLAWNWWRLRWELGRPAGQDARRRWDFAHRVATVGEGYAWPNIMIFSDGLQSFLESEPSGSPGAVLFRYIGAQRREVVSTEEMESAVDGFVEGVLARLDDRGIHGTNLHRLWIDLVTEREDPEATRFRRLEAQLGCDPDDADEDAVNHHLYDASILGERALGEIAGDAALRGSRDNRMLFASEISEIALGSGFDGNMNDAVRLADGTMLPRPGTVRAWRVGESAALSLRDQLGLNGGQVSDRELSEFAGTTSGIISDTHRRSDAMSFLLDRSGDSARVVLRSKWETGRRFELARLLGDRVVGRRMRHAGECLLPATRTYSYRQKVQRAFAAEFLGPFAKVDEMLNGDYSEEAQNGVAEYFGVSPMTIRTQLVNGGRIELEDAPDIASRGAD